MAEHREPYDLRESRTVLGARGGEIPPRDSPDGVRIAGKRMYLWHAVDHECEVLDMLVQRRRDTKAALLLLRKLLKKQGFAPKLLITDRLGSYGSAFRQLRLTCPSRSRPQKE